jgi:hypothetical protein
MSRSHRARWTRESPPILHESGSPMCKKKRVVSNRSHEGEWEEIRTRNISIQVSRRAGWDWQGIQWLRATMMRVRWCTTRKPDAFCSFECFRLPLHGWFPSFCSTFIKYPPCSSSSIPNIHHVFPHYRSQVLPTHVPCAEPVSDRTNLVGYGSYGAGTGYLT